MHGLDRNSVIQLTPSGMYCPAGSFYIDPWRPVNRAVITHAHSDHARTGSQNYLCASAGESVLRVRVGAKPIIRSLPYGERLRLGDAYLSFHPAGHILGSAQVRVEVDGEVWVVSGDYNTAPDPGCGASFEAVPCHTFITESTFGLPIYRWPSSESVFSAILRWWRRNAENGVTTVVPAYPLGKSQRLLAHLDDSIGPVGIHGNAATFADAYREAGIRQVATRSLAEAVDLLKGRGFVVTSTAARDDSLLRQLEPISWAFASGWMMTRAARRNRDFDRGFVLSDHADWDGLVSAIRATGAERVGVTHGQTESFSRWLREQGWEAFQVPTRFAEPLESVPTSDDSSPLDRGTQDTGFPLGRPPGDEMGS